MGKSLIDKLRKGWRNTKLIATAVAAIGLAGCLNECTPIPTNYAPEFTSTPVTQAVKGQAYTYDATAKDIDGDKLVFTLPLAPSEYSINSGTGVVSGVPDSTGSFDLEVGVSDGINPVVKQDYTLTVADTPQPPAVDYLDVTGQIENDKTRAFQEGKVKIFDSANETTPIAIVDSDSKGYFVYHSTTKKVSDLSGVSLKAVLTDPSGNPESYANTMRYPAGDVTRAVLEPYPHITFNTNGDGDGVVNQTDYNNYKEHRRRTNIRTDIMPEDNKERGLMKWDLEGKVAPENSLKGIIIFQTNPNKLKGFFSTGNGSQLEILETKIKDSNDIEVALRGSNFNSGQLDSLIFDSSSGIGYTSNEIIQPNPGYILVIPDNTLGSNIEGDTSWGYYQHYTTGIVNSAIIKINPNIGNSNNFKTVVSHEFLHALIDPYDLPLVSDNPPIYDAQTLGGNTSPPNPDLTILRYDTLNTTLGNGAADIEDAYVNNGYSPREKLDDIFGDW